MLFVDVSAGDEHPPHSQLFSAFRLVVDFCNNLHLLENAASLMIDDTLACGYKGMYIDGSSELDCFRDIVFL